MTREKFIKKLKEDDTIQESGPFTEEALQGAKELENGEEFEALLSNIDHQIDQKWSKPNSIKRLLYGTAVAAALVGLIVYGTFLINGTPNAQKLYSEYFQPFPNTLVTIERGNTENNPAVKGMIAYNQQQYATALIQFKEILTQPDQDIEWNLYYGIAALETNHFDQAILAFENVLNQTSNKNYREAAHWYRTLLLVKTEQWNAAKRQLQLISQSDSYFQKQAQHLLEEL